MTRSVAPAHVTPPPAIRSGRWARAEEARGLADRLRMGRRRVSRSVRLGGEGLHPHDLVVQHVPRDVDEHRAPAPRHRGAKREPEHVRDPAGRVTWIDSFVTGRKSATRSSSWKASRPSSPSGGSAGDRHDGRVRHVGPRDAGDEVRRAGSARHQAHGRHAGDPRETVGHEGAALLVTDVHVLHALVVVEDVQHVEEGRADDPEDVPHRPRPSGARRRPGPALISVTAHSPERWRRRDRMRSRARRASGLVARSRAVSGPARDRSGSR